MFGDKVSCISTLPNILTKAGKCVQLFFEHGFPSLMAMLTTDFRTTDPFSSYN